MWPRTLRASESRSSSKSSLRWRRRCMYLSLILKQSIILSFIVFFWLFWLNKTRAAGLWSQFFRGYKSSQFEISILNSVSSVSVFMKHKFYLSTTIGSSMHFIVFNFLVFMQMKLSNSATIYFDPCSLFSP